MGSFWSKFVKFSDHKTGAYITCGIIFFAIVCVCSYFKIHLPELPKQATSTVPPASVASPVPFADAEDVVADVTVDPTLPNGTNYFFLETSNKKLVGAERIKLRFTIINPPPKANLITFSLRNTEGGSLHGSYPNIREAKVLIERWRVQYNTKRPHSSLGYRPPAPEAFWPLPPSSGAASLLPAAVEISQEELT